MFNDEKDDGRKRNENRSRKGMKKGKKTRTGQEKRNENRTGKGTTRRTKTEREKETDNKKGHGKETGKKTEQKQDRKRHHNTDMQDRNKRDDEEEPTTKNNECFSSADFHQVSVFGYFFYFICVLFELSYSTVCNSNFSLFSVCYPSSFYRMRFFVLNFTV